MQGRYRFFGSGDERKKLIWHIKANENTDKEYLVIFWGESL